MDLDDTKERVTPGRGDLGAFGHGQFRTDYEDRVDPRSLLEQRLARAYEAMNRAGLDALLCWKDETSAISRDYAHKSSPGRAPC